MIPLTEFLVFAATFLLSFVIIRARKYKGKDYLRHPPSLPSLPKDKGKDGRRHPPSLPSLPIVGSIPFTTGLDDLPGFVMKKASELGPVFTFTFLGRRVAVLSSLEAIEDAFVKHASSFSGRASFYSDRYVVNRNQKGIGGMNYTESFKKYHKLNMSILKEFGFNVKNQMETLMLSEVDHLIDYVKKMNGKAFDPKEMIIMSSSNVPLNMLLGKRRNLKEGMDEIIAEMGKYIEAYDPALDFVPVLRFFPPHKSKLEEFKHHFSRLMDLIQKECEEIFQNKSVDCFVRRYIEKEGKDYDHEQLLFTVRDFIAGSTEPTSTIFLCSFIFLANNPNVAERIQKEIDSVVPRDRLPSIEDREKLPYTEATIFEVLRCRAPAPLGIPHLTLHDTEVLGYFIPANTTVFSSIIYAHTNPVDWPDGNVFRPERFLDIDGKLFNKKREIAFSLGRRSCPGEALARHQLFVYISGLLQNFSFLPPEGTDCISEKLIHGIVECPCPFTIRMIARD